MIKIDVQNARLGYDGKEILREVNFSVMPGEFVGLIGPNGSGKSTIIRTITRTIPLQGGRISIDDRDVTAIPRQSLSRLLGVVPQIPLLPSAFTAFEVVLMGRNPHMGLFKMEGEREISLTREAMERTKTWHLAFRKIGELSGGEIQCLLIARLLVQETKAILMDEPTANLDIGRQVEVLDLIKNLCREKNLAVLTVLHDLNLAAQYCDRLVLINKGKVQAMGTPVQVITAANMAEVYCTENCVFTHPINGLPTVLLASGSNRKEDALKRT